MMEMRPKQILDPSVGLRHAPPFESITNPAEKPRGFLSFLTGPMLWAQLFAAYQMLGSALRPAAADETANKSPAAADDSAAGDAADQPVPLVAVTVNDDPQFEETKDAEGTSADTMTDATLAESGGGPVAGFTVTMASDTDGSSSVAGGAGSVVLVDPDLPTEPVAAALLPSSAIPAAPVVVDAAPAPVGDGPATIPPIVDAIAPPVVDVVDGVKDTVTGVVGSAGPIVQSIAPPLVEAVPDLVKDVAGTVVPVVESVVQPLVPVVEAVPDLVQEIVGTAGPVVESIVQPLAPVVEVVPDLVQDIVGTAGPVVESIVQPLAPAMEAVPDLLTEVAESVVPVVSAVPDLVADVVGTTDPIVQSIATDVVEPVTDLVGEVTKPVESTLDSGLDLGVALASVLSPPGDAPITYDANDSTAQKASSSDGGPVESLLGGLGIGPAATGDSDFMGSPGSLSFAEAPASAIAVDELFNDRGGYTDYRIAIDGDGKAQSTGSVLESGDTNGDATASKPGLLSESDHAEDQKHDTPSLPQTPVMAELSGVLGDLDLRGDGGLL